MTLPGQSGNVLSVATDTLNLAPLSASERIALMERLWESLSISDDLLDPPDWHEAVLREREAEWRERDAISQDWDSAKDEIRKKVT